MTQTDNATGSLQIEALGDVNGDGLVDFALICADEKRQEVFGVR